MKYHLNFNSLIIMPVLNILNNGSFRSVRVKKQALYAFIAKVLDAFFSFFLIRITLTYLNEYEYGLWITLSSILTWINCCDIGFGNGLRNKLSEALALNDLGLGRQYVSTAFAAIIAIALIIFVIYALVAPIIDWNKILNVSENIPKLNLYVSLFVLMFLFNFVLKLLGAIYSAQMLTSVGQAIHLAGVVLSLIIIYILTIFKKQGSFIELGFIHCLASLFIYLLLYPYTFYVRYSELKPSIKFFRRFMFKDLMQLSWQFFLIQVAVVVFFIATNFIIAQLFSPQHVTPYNIANKYYSLLYISSCVLWSPIWPAATNAYVQQDIAWLRSSFKKNMFVFGGIFLFFIIMFLLAPFVFKIWLGDNVSISPQLSFVVMIQNVIFSYGSLICCYINGIGKIRLQLYGYWACIVVYSIICCWISKSFEVPGIIGSVCVVLFPLHILLTVQFFKIISGKAKGIWMQ